jgi:hypothetical protein
MPIIPPTIHHVSNERGPANPLLLVMIAAAAGGEAGDEVKFTVAFTEALFAKFTEAGAIAQATPTTVCGAQLKATELLEPLSGAIVRVVLPCWPAVIVIDAGFGLIEKSGTITLTKMPADSVV